jgi:hypothetical protein
MIAAFPLPLEAGGPGKRTIEGDTAVAKQKRKQAPAKPITTHQLFPAVVALWFGALFGLGSLAVRPSLLESLVISSRIDLIVPAAAPPLGITARILVALILAAIGSAIGIAIARRLARPKQEHRERKRGAGSVIEESDKLHGGRHYADATTRTPISVSEELRPNMAGDDSSFGSGGLAPRRRSLAIEHEEVDFVPHEMAPLPGGVPQILDIGEVRISPEAPEAPLDLGDYVAPSAPTSAVQLDWNNAAPVQSAPGIEPQPPRQVFQPLDELEAAPATTPEAFTAHHQDTAQETAAAVADGRQVFGMAAQPAPEDSARQIFGQPVSGDHVDPEFVKAAGFKTSVFDTETPSPLFPTRETAASPAAQPAEFAVPPAPQVQAYQVPEAYVPPSQFVADAAETAQTEPVAVVPSEPAPVLPSAAGLGMDDLASRLAESMARRRAARSGAPVEAPIVAEPTPIPAPYEAPAVVAEPAIPVAYEAVAAMPAEAESLPSEFAALAVPQAYVPPISAEPLAPFSLPFAAPAPIAAQPEAAQAEPAPQPTEIPQAQPIPQAMRPLDLGGFEEDDAPLDNVLPPRMIAMPAVLAEPPTPVASAAFAAPSDEAEIANDGVAEESYGSLLGVVPAAPTRTGFVRIEEPEAENAATEPVVIFPGQMTRPIVPVSSEDAGSFRRFDAPASAGQGQPIAANQALSDVDSEEAQRALRSALANLQRMSGAA